MLKMIITPELKSDVFSKMCKQLKLEEVEQNEAIPKKLSRREIDKLFKDLKFSSLECSALWSKLKWYNNTNHLRLHAKKHAFTNAETLIDWLILHSLFPQEKDVICKTILSMVQERNYNLTEDEIMHLKSKPSFSILTHYANTT